MQDITLRQIEIFLAVAEELSQTDAARNLYIGQPSVSRWIQRLEESLKAQLFIRTKTGVDLTPDGEYLYSEFKPLFDKLNNTLRNVRAIYSTPENVLRVGCYHSDELVNEFRAHLRPFEKLHPDTLIKVELYEYKDLYEKLLCGNLNCAVSYEIGFSTPKSMEQKRFKRPAAFFAVRASHPLIVKGSLDLRGLQDETLFLVMTPESDLSEDWKLDLCHKNGFAPKNIEYLSNPFAREMAIKNSRGFSIGGTDQNCHFPEDIALFPATERSEKEQFMLLVWRRNASSEMTKALIDSFPNS